MFDGPGFIPIPSSSSSSSEDDETRSPKPSLSSSSSSSSSTSSDCLAGTFGLEGPDKLWSAIKSGTESPSILSRSSSMGVRPAPESVPVESEIEVDCVGAVKWGDLTILDPEELRIDTGVVIVRRGDLVGVSTLTVLIRWRLPFGLGDPYEYLAIRDASAAAVAVDEGLSAGSCFMM